MRPALAVLMVCALLANTAEAGAKKDKPASAKVAKVVKVSKLKKPGGKAPKFIKGGEESTAERDRRLLRECKGRVNAGACLGYTG